MDVTKLALDAAVVAAPGGAAGAAAAVVPVPVVMFGARALPGLPNPPSLPGASGIDRVDIQPLDAVAALQILIAEVRTELGLPMPAVGVDRASAGDAGLTANPTATAQLLIRLFVAALPQAGSAAEWLVAVDRLETTLQTALDRGVAAVAGWQEVSQTVRDTTHEVRAAVLGLLTEMPLSPYWVRPEWMGIAPAVQRFWRRRRRARAGLIDPDLAPQASHTSDPDAPVEQRSGD